MKIQTASRTRIKICGLRSLEHAHLASACGADSIGLVFHQASSRFIEPLAAERIVRQMPAFTSVTALFLDEIEDWVAQVIDQVDPDYLQFHGNESAHYCDQWQRPYIKAIPMGSVDDISVYANGFPNARGFLLDSHVAGRLGGSGDTFDWSKIPSDFQPPLILAGGLTPDNVADAVNQVRPWAVDVSSGVEASRGVKDPTLIKQFCNEVLRVDCQSRND